ncbi:MAG TPA: TonB-dependent receptor [Gammaproteobacteria bacterium]|nr:TonB-dependent receptor [Gammaproteobacteria bacterium]
MSQGSERKGKHQRKTRVAKRQLAVAVSGGLFAAATYAQQPTTTEPEAVATSAIEELVVTARNRTERAQGVPVPISVIGGQQIDRDRAFTIADLTQRAPGLTATTPNARRTGVSIRGIGKASGNDNMEAAVGMIVDDVFLGHVGMSYQDFTDLERVEILRGPQGTLLGKNTTLGVIKYTSRAPSFSPEGSVDVELGLDPSATKTRGSFSNALIDDVLAYRVSFFADEQDGDLVNVNPAVGGSWHERNRYGGRFQLLYTPTDALSVRFNLDRAATDENSNTKPFMVEPLTLDDGSPRGTTYSSRLARTYFGGYQPIIGSWDEIDIDMAKPLKTTNAGLSTIVDWDLGAVTFTSITAAREFHFDANNDQEQTRFAIRRTGTLVDTKQLSQEFRFTGSPSDKLDYQAGLYLFNIKTDTLGRNYNGIDAGAFFATNAQYAALDTPASQPLLQASLNDILQTTYSNPETDSAAVFGQVDWHLAEKTTLTLGLRRTVEDKTSDIEKGASYLDGSPLLSTGNATADAIRAAQLGNLYGRLPGEPLHEASYSWLVNPSYQLTGDVLLYASVAAGEKSGSVQFDSADGSPQNVLPERSQNFELGVKSTLNDRKVLLNANLYQTRVEDYQATTSVADVTSPTGFSSVLGNIPEIRARGVELDAAYTVTPALQLNFGAAYNDAVYSDWATATCPRNVPATITVCDNTGKQIVGAPKWTGVIGLDYEFALAGNFMGRVFGNHTYRSEHNLEQLLSPYGWQDDYTVTDLGIGFTRDTRGATYEVNLVGKNVFDTHYTTSVNDFSNNAPVGYDGIGPRRYVGVDLRVSF